MPRTPTRARGLFKNGENWWLRVRGPGGRGARRSTGTPNLVLANSVVAMVATLRDSRPQWDLLERAVAGELPLLTLYNHFAAGTLDALRRELTLAAQAAPANLEPLVDRWRDTHLPSCDLSPQQVSDYVRQVRALVPAGVAFPVTTWTEDTLKAKLLSLTDARSGQPLSSSTRRRYVAAWRLFHKFARKHVGPLADPFADTDWLPENNSPRSIYWDHETRLRVLACMSGEARSAVALMLGSGIELSALRALRGLDLGQGRTLVAHGTKNGYREDRTIFVDAWAWKEFVAHRPLALAQAPIVTLTDAQLRREFYEAQVAAGLVTKPETSDSYKRLWRGVKPHTLHDCRHTFAVCRALGLDGEARQSARWIAYNLGHADEQMVLRIYAKARIEDRLRLLELAEAKQQGAVEAREAR